jgi:replicative DNA helicase
VVLLWGSAGDPIVEMRHLKQAAAEGGLMKLLNTSEGGISIYHGTDLVALASQCRDGMTVEMAAANLYPPTGKRVRRPDSEIE